MSHMSFPVIPLPKAENKNDEEMAEFIQKLDDDAKQQGLSSWLELLAQDPGMRDIISRMMKAETSALKERREAAKTS